MRGMVLTLDAIIAMLIMTSAISLLIFFRIESSSPFFTAEQLHFISEDSLNILSESTFREVGNQTILTNSTLFNMYYNQSGILDQSDLDKKAIDVLGELWSDNASESLEGAANITKDILGNMLPDSLGYQILINNYNVYNSSDTSRPSESDAEAGISSGRIASGYESNRTVGGCVALAYLTSKKDSSYVYFGGFVGNGNITTNITLPNFDKVLEAYMEMDDSSNFTLYINKINAGNYRNGTAGGGFMTADKWIVCNFTWSYLDPSKNCSSLSFFQPNENELQINFTNQNFTNNSYIGGGYFRVTYNTTDLIPQEHTGYEKIRLPGIDGTINLYDSFYVSGNLSNMNISLYFKISPANQPLSIYVGNTLVGNSSISPIIVSNASITSAIANDGLSYTDLSEKTVPIRIGHNSIINTNQTGYATDVILTTSLIDKMDTCDINSDPVGGTYINVTPDCNSTTGIQNKRIDLAKVLDTIFVNVVLNNTGNRVGLLGYVTPGYQFPVPLTTNNQSLINNITTYQTKNGDRCTCCAIDTSIGMLTDPLRKRYIVLMSDGIVDKNSPPGQCTNQAECPLTAVQYQSLTNGGQNATVKEAYYAYTHNITVDTIGFGPGADNNLMNLTAICGGGQFKSSTNYSNLLTIYENISTEISNVTVIYANQNCQMCDINSTLFPNSSIKFNYIPHTISQDYGNISLTIDGTTLGKLTNDNSIGIPCKNGTYYFPTQVAVTDAKMTSYSSEYWTNRLSVQNATGGPWYTAFNLSYFGSYYGSLGDPFIINVPYKYLPVSGNNYSVNICTANRSKVEVGGSPDDRFIYTIRVKNSVLYGSLNDTCEGAIEDANRRLNDTIGGYLGFNFNAKNETNTISKVPYMWGPANIRIRVWS